MIIFDRIARLNDAARSQPGNGRDERGLDIFRQRGRNAVGIDGVVVETFRLQKNLMAIAVTEISQSCLRSTGNSADRGLRSVRNTSASDEDCRGSLVRRGCRARDAAFDLRICQCVGQH